MCKTDSVTHQARELIPATFKKFVGIKAIWKLKMRFHVVEDICPVVVGLGHYPESEHFFLLEALVGVSA